MSRIKMLVVMAMMLVCTSVFGFVSIPITRMQNAVHAYPPGSATGLTIQDAYDYLTSSDRDARMGTIGVLNRRTLILTPGTYTSTSIVLDTDYVDIVGIGSVIITDTAGAVIDCGSKITRISNVTLDGSSIANCLTNDTAAVCQSVTVTDGTIIEVLVDGISGAITYDQTNDALELGTVALDLDQFISNGVTFTLPTADGTVGQALVTNGSGVLSWSAVAGTFTGGNITADCILNADGIDILADTTTAHTYSIGVRDIDGAAYTDVLRWTNGDIPAIAIGSDTSTFALNSTTIDIAAGAITGVTTINTSGAVTVGGALSASSWVIGAGAFSTTGATTLGNNTSTVAISSTGIDISTLGAVSNVTTLGMSGDLTNSGGDILLSTGKGVKSSTTNAHTVGVYGYDTDGAYVAALAVTNSATPATVLGNTNGTTAISSSDWTISTAGALAGIGAIDMDGALSIDNATPTININDSDATDGDDNVTLVAAATDTGSGSEDADFTISQQIAGTLRTVVTIDADGDITLGYGTQNVVSTADITVTGSDLSLGTAGVKLTGDGDGAITFLGLGDGSDEDLTINLDDTANTAVVTSSTLLDTIVFTTIQLDTDAVDITHATPQFTLKDTDAAAGDDNAYIVAAATDTGDGTEDVDVTMSQQVAGAAHDFLVSDADGNLTLDSGGGVIAMTDTVTFSGGQTRKQFFTPKDVELDGASPAVLTDIGTDGQANVSTLTFDADGGVDGDDIAYIMWHVPDGYVTGSARLNVAYSFSTAEDAADEAQFDFTVNAIGQNEAIDAAGTALADQTTAITDASSDNGNIHTSQYDIEVEDIVVDDYVIIKIAVDESASTLTASSTLDVHYFEIEWESTE